MEDAVGGGAQEQSEAVTAVGAHNDEVATDFLGDAVDFRFRSTEDQVLALLRNLQGGAEIPELALGLLVNLVLHAGEIHGNIAPVSEAEGFNDVQHGHYCTAGRSKGLGPFPDTLSIFREINCEQQMGVIGHGP